MDTNNTAYPVDSRYSWLVAAGNYKVIFDTHLICKFS